ncbi:polysaccharide biosynthesis/export family protein [Chondrinema litorale]|uniref:polysaccharide biosynthesis/export family protein n=1 Tax=Chondrinema litorale TaxID=2994555 RepID=UPI002543D01F|nr:polysaccharide biosynthesis/export family protein [Chondrinema litorale]UZS00176.1 polysaccharide biosynthesis/export family protein [Chondrinema litorale]
MQDKVRDKTFDSYSTNNYKVRPFDNLSIKLNSFEQSTTGEFNSSGALGSRPGGVDNALLYLSGYMVNQAGNIRLPLIGDIKVVDLTVDEIKDLIDLKLEEYLKFPSVSVKLTNFRVSVLGEVNRPGMQYIYEGKVTLLQALSQAGDLTDFGNRKNIKLIRETKEKTISTYIDITKPDLISSEYYFLMPNDVLYIEPLKAKASNVNTRVVGVALSVISVVITTVNLIVTINNK